MLDRRQFMLSSLGALVARQTMRAEGLDLKIGHRQASVTKQAGPSVFEIVRQIPGISGVELQVHYGGATLWDRDTALSYKKDAERTGLLIHSIAGIWGPGASIMQPGPGEQSLRKAINAAELVGASIALTTAFRNNCPDMSHEESYGPAVALLQSVASAAADAGVTIAMETTLTPADDKKLIDLVDRPSVKVNYDADNTESFGYHGQGVLGFEVLGAARIGQIHLKNEDRLLEEPGRIDWVAALKAVRGIGYRGWLVLETRHSAPEQCIEATRKNVEFIKRQLA